MPLKLPQDPQKRQTLANGVAKLAKLPRAKQRQVLQAEIAKRGLKAPTSAK